MRRYAFSGKVPVIGIYTLPPRKKGDTQGVCDPVTYHKVLVYFKTVTYQVVYLHVE